MAKPESAETDGHGGLTPRHKKLLFRSTHRGTREMDAVVGGFAKRHIRDLDDTQLDRFEVLLEESDNDLFDWISGKVPVPDAFDNDVMRMLRAYKEDPPAP